MDWLEEIGDNLKQTLKDYISNGKFDRPEYWASFIMLDGLN